MASGRPTERPDVPRRRWLDRFPAAILAFGPPKEDEEEEGGEDDEADDEEERL